MYTLNHGSRITLLALSCASAHVLMLGPVQLLALEAAVLGQLAAGTHEHLGPVAASVAHASQDSRGVNACSVDSRFSPCACRSALWFLGRRCRRRRLDSLYRGRPWEYHIGRAHQLCEPV